VLNAGDGAGEHPTQALLDFVTICSERSALSAAATDAESLVTGLKIALVGDLKHGRTVHSLARLLSLYKVSFVFVAPKGLGMPKEVADAVEANGCTYMEVNTLAECVSACDVMYVTRVQKERFDSIADYEAAQGSYIVDAELMSKVRKCAHDIGCIACACNIALFCSMRLALGCRTHTGCSGEINNHVAFCPQAKKHAILMHPLPRVGEIKEEVDSDPRAAYFRQMRYGLYTRMAILKLVLQ